MSEMAPDIRRSALRRQRRQARRRRDLLVWGSIAAVVLIAIAGLLYAGGRGRQARAAFAINVGDRAPDFALPAVEGGTVTLADLRRQGNVLLFFYEGIMCPPCWDQLTAIQRDYPQFRELGIDRVVGITVDRFDNMVVKAREEQITLPVLVDEGARVSRTYDTLRVGSMHPGQRPGHTFILVDRDGVVRWRRDFREMFVPNQVLLTDLRSLR